MLRRNPVAANAFYEGSPDACRAHVERLFRGVQPPEDLGEVVGAVVPHAGWIFSGPTAAKAFAALQGAEPEVFVLFGAVHRPFSSEAQAFPEGAWETPLGDVEVDASALAAVRDAGVLLSERHHQGEHSIEVQLPLIKHLCPDARILPVAVPHGPGAAETGRRIGQAVSGLDSRCVVVASTDLTHYGMGYDGAAHGRFPGAMKWMEANDRRFIRLVEALDAEAVVDEAAANGNACGAGAVAAALAAARVMGATRGVTLEYTTSAHATGDLNTDRAVGYLAAALVRGNGG